MRELKVFSDTAVLVKNGRAFHSRPIRQVNDFLTSCEVARRTVKLMPLPCVTP